jgi:hypothetical protein
MHVQNKRRPAFRIIRGSSGLWEVVEDGIREALALFRAPQAALSYACDLAAMHKGSLVMVFDHVSPRTAAPVHQHRGPASLQ